ncbi:MAG: hypothetical protein II180_11465, partial [Proteobacteria bacterium]|nr:hypothetical protein [Pseudomonadota bacterium]
RLPPVNVKRPVGALNVCAPTGRFLILGVVHRQMCGGADAPYRGRCMTVGCVASRMRRIGDDV